MEPGVTSMSNTPSRMKQGEMPNMNYVNPPDIAMNTYIY